MKTALRSRAVGKLKLLPYDADIHAPLIWVYCALQDDIRADILWDLQEKERSHVRRDALSAGYSSLRNEVRRCVREARDEGRLLLCWHGTKALEVPA